MKTRDRVIALAKQGVAPSEIAVRVQRAPQSVYDYLKKARKDGVKIPRFPTGPKPQAQATFVAIGTPSMKKLRPQATRRGMSVPELVAELTRVIADDGLVGSILDDTGGSKNA